MFCYLPTMTLRALNESHLVCSVRFRQRRSIYKELTVYQIYSEWVTEEIGIA